MFRNVHIIVIIIQVLVAIISCDHYSPQVRQVLELAGDNREELEQLLAYYRKDPEKLSAAVFLIENMTDFFSVDPLILLKYEPFYKMCDSINRCYQHKMTMQRISEIDSLWKMYQLETPFYYRYNNQLDYKNISASVLIQEIELAFKAWKENIYTHTCSFSDFCEYILPYRRENGLLIDNARHIFHNRHRVRFFTGQYFDFIDESDSLLYLYRHIKHSNFAGAGIPIFTASTLERIQFGLCEDRCWYNSLLFSSLGMPVAVDFVPQWGNRNGAHSWNVLIVEGQSYAFEPFWDEDRWKYKRIYNNRSFDIKWGRFRLPKVYRYTYSNNAEGPMTNHRIPMTDIPELFKLKKKKDVSNEYFDTEDVTVLLEQDIPENCFYAYLCVFNSGKWKPVQWGEISGKKAIFKGMGKDIIYLPAFFRNGTVLPAGKPFLLTTDGHVEVFNPQVSGKQLSVRYVCGTFEHFRSQDKIRSMAGAVFLGATSLNFENPDTLCVVPDSLELYTHQINFLPQIYRCVRICLNNKLLALNDLCFLEESEREMRPIETLSFITKLPHPSNKTESPEFILDQFQTTGYLSGKQLKHIDIDLGRACNLAAVRLTPYTDIEFAENSSWRLMYWDSDNQWKISSTEQVSNGHLIFRNVPDNALLIIEGTENNTIASNRIFIYDNGVPKWY